MEQDACNGLLVVSTLLKNLPVDLDLTHYFDGQPEVDLSFSQLLERNPSNKAAGPLGPVLARYGLTVCIIKEMLWEVSKTVHHFQKKHQISEYMPVTLSEYTFATPPSIARGDLVQKMVSVSDLDENVAERLLNWFVAVAFVKPKIFPHFIFDDGKFRPGGLDPDWINDLWEAWNYRRS